MGYGSAPEDHGCGDTSSATRTGASSRLVYPSRPGSVGGTTTAPPSAGCSGSSGPARRSETSRSGSAVGTASTIASAAGAGTARSSAWPRRCASAWTGRARSTGTHSASTTRACVRHARQRAGGKNPRTSRETTRWAVREAEGDRNCTWSLTAGEFPSPPASTRGRRTSRRVAASVG